MLIITHLDTLVIILFAVFGDARTVHCLRSLWYFSRRQFCTNYCWNRLYAELLPDLCYNAEANMLARHFAIRYNYTTASGPQSYIHLRGQLCFRHPTVELQLATSKTSINLNFHSLEANVFGTWDAVLTSFSLVEQPDMLMGLERKWTASVLLV